MAVLTSQARAKLKEAVGPLDPADSLDPLDEKLKAPGFSSFYNDGHYNPSETNPRRINH